MKKVVIAVLGLGVLAIAAAGALVFTVANHVDQAIEQEHSFTVGRGDHLKSILDKLGDAGVLERPRWVYLFARASKNTSVKTGMYRIEPTTTPRELLEILGEGRVLTESFSFPEGYNRWQIRDILAEEKWMEAKRFDELCDDTKFLKKYGVPGPTCEGYLFPETYTFARGVSPENIFGTIFGEWKKAYEAVVAAHGNGPLDFDARQFMTLASIVEKETGAAQERPRIACVFYNRLTAQPKWRLETDPTVIYAATLEDPNFDGNLKSYHLRQLENPYNTYKNVGLPPGPIASPGRAALNAVAKPSSCDDFFFVSKNNGEHVFCPTYECHLKNVQKWQVQYFRKKR